MKRIRSERIPLEKLTSWDIAEMLLPEYTVQQYKDLEDFIGTGGQLAPITVAEDGRIIDGYNRWRTAQRLCLEEIECDVYSYDDEAEMEVHAIVLNSKRRHLNKVQIARAAARLAQIMIASAPEAEEEPEKESKTRKTEVSGSAEEAAAEEQSEEKNAAPVSRPEKAVRTVSHKLGVLPSTVQQVSKVDQTGDERLISAMEDKTISIRQAAELADMEEDERVQAFEALGESRKKKNEFTEVFSRTCSECFRKLSGTGRKIKEGGYSESDLRDMKTSLTKVIAEANMLMHLLEENVGTGDVKTEGE
jgi:ParB-like chromosome segregation protein Spo0J